MIYKFGIKNISKVLRIFFFVTLYIYGNSQSIEDKDITQPESGKIFRKWEVFAGYASYFPAETTHKYGNYHIENHPVPSVNAGINFTYPLNHNWYVKNGLWLNLEPQFNFSTTIKKEDLYPGTYDVRIVRAKSYSVLSPSLPIIFQKDWRFQNATSVNLQLGGRLMYLSRGYCFFEQLSLQSSGLTKPVFRLELFSKKTNFYPGLIAGFGFAFPMKRAYLSTYVYYIHNLINTMQGHYRFFNLRKSEESYGTYSFSGSYLNIQMAVRLLKDRKKFAPISKISSRQSGKYEHSHKKESSQTSHNKNHILSKYQRLGIHFSLDINQPARMDTMSGKELWTLHSNMSYSTGLNYRFYMNKNGLLNTGLWVRKETNFILSYRLSANALHQNNDSIIESVYYQSSGYSIGFPLYYSHLFQIFGKTMVEISGGTKLSLVLNNKSADIEDYTLDYTSFENIKILEGKLTSKKNPVNGSLLIGSGIFYPFDKFLLQFRVLYVHNIKAIAQGNFRFVNLSGIPESGGDFSISGNHISFQILVHLKR